MSTELKTLQDAIIYFSNLDNCLNYLVQRRWPNGAICPTCGRTDVTFVAARGVWQCKTRHPRAQFSIKIGTIMEDSPLGLDKWLPAMWHIANCKNVISSRELHREIGVTQKTAWFMLHRIRLALQDDLSDGTLDGEVEVDETYIGGKSRHMHKSRKRRVKAKGRNTGRKAVVLAMLQREGKNAKKVRATVIPDRTRVSIQPMISGDVEPGKQIFCDEHAHVWRMDDDFFDNIVNHLERYLDGHVHTNGMENFWSLLKRGIGGTYVCLEPFHLFRYVEEQAFRSNNRYGMQDRDRFRTLETQVICKRLTYEELTGKVGNKEKGL